MAGKSLNNKVAGNKKAAARIKRKVRVRKSIRGTDERPRLCVFRSLRYTTAQLISDSASNKGNRVVLSATTKDIDTAGASRSGKDSAKVLGVKIAELAKSNNISEVVFDRNGYLYHGRVAAVAEGAREGGLKF